MPAPDDAVPRAWEIIHPLVWSTRASITPSLTALPTMYSASSSESKCSFTHMSRREMSEYARERERTPVLITLWRSRRMSLYVESWENRALCVTRADWNCDKSPVRTADTTSRKRIRSFATLAQLVIRRNKTYPVQFVSMAPKLFLEQDL